MAFTFFSYSSTKQEDQLIWFESIWEQKKAKGKGGKRGEKWKRL